MDLDQRRIDAIDARIPRPEPLIRSRIPVDLRGMADHYHKEMGAYMKAHRPLLNRTLGLGGTTANIEQVLRYPLFKLAQAGAWIAPATDASDADAFDRMANLKAGCEAIAARTCQILQEYQKTDAKTQGYRIHAYMVGLVMEHHAVCVEPREGKSIDGFVFDAWITQTPAIYTMRNWRAQFRGRGLLGAPRSEWE